MPRESASGGHKKIFSLMKKIYPYHKIYQEYPYSKILKFQYKKLNVADIFQNNYYLEYGNKLFADVYDATIGLVIEIQGKQHYEPTQWSNKEDPDLAQQRFIRQKNIDKLKRDISNEAGVIFLEIPYWSINELNENSFYELVLKTMEKGIR